MITVERRALLAGMAIARGAIERGASIPVLSTMRGVANGAMHLSGTDLDVEVRASVPYEGDTSSPFLLRDHAYLAHALRHGGADKVNLLPSEDASVTVRSGMLEVVEKGGAHVDDWPTFAPIAQQTFSATLSREHLATVRRIASAISTEETRYYLNGVFLHRLGENGWTYRAVATDGHRLMYADLELPDADGSLGRGIILPRRTLNILFTHLGKAESVALRCGNAIKPNTPEATTAPEKACASRVQLEAAVGGIGVGVLTKLIDGTYPEYQRVVPRERAAQIAIKIGALRQAVQALVVPGEKLPIVTLTVAQGALTIATAIKARELAASVSIAAETTQPDGYVVSFNGRYLLDMLAGLGGDEIVIEQASSAAPALMRNSADTSVTGLLMPTRF